MVPAYLQRLSGCAADEKRETLKELGSLRQNLEHIKGIVAKQQEYSRLAAFTESVKLTDLVEDALELTENAFADGRVQLIRELGENVPVIVDKHKVVQILLSLIHNAREACDNLGGDGRQVCIRTSRAARADADRSARQRSWHREGESHAVFPPRLHHQEERPRLWPAWRGQRRHGNGRQPQGAE